MDFGRGGGKVCCSEGGQETLDASWGVAVGDPSRTRGWRNWQTRQIQVLVAERLWGFKSPSSHQRDRVSRAWGAWGEEPSRLRAFAGGQRRLPFNSRRWATASRPLPW